MVFTILSEIISAVWYMPSLTNPIENPLSAYAAFSECDDLNLINYLIGEYTKYKFKTNIDCYLKVF